VAFPVEILAELADAQRAHRVEGRHVPGNDENLHAVRLLANPRCSIRDLIGRSLLPGE
jgi:hypothetical protein